MDPRRRRPRARARARSARGGHRPVALVAARGPARRRQPQIDDRATLARVPRRRGDRWPRAPVSSRRCPVRPRGSADRRSGQTAKDVRDAALLTAMAATPHAVWFEASTPEEVQSAVHMTVIRATHEERVPVLVANNIPFRDCAQYCAGGASRRGGLRGLDRRLREGHRQREGGGHPRARQPRHHPLQHAARRLHRLAASRRSPTRRARRSRPQAPPPAIGTRCSPSAVDTIESQAPNAAVYLDGTHSAWLAVGDIAYRLAQAGIERAQGFSVNVSNYQPTPG